MIPIDIISMIFDLSILDQFTLAMALALEYSGSVVFGRLVVVSCHLSHWQVRNLHLYGLVERTPRFIFHIVPLDLVTHRTSRLEIVNKIQYSINFYKCKPNSAI